MKKIKNILRRVISLVLALNMIIPTGAFAANHTVDNWDEYREKIKEGILNQEEEIVIQFNGDETFSTEYFARLKIAHEYEKAKEEIPLYLTELNIIDEKTIPVLDGTINAPLESIRHTIEYRNSKEDFNRIREILKEQYGNIKAKATDYEKIKEAYDYIVISLKDIEAEEPEIKTILSPQGDNAYAILFAMMMDELGYDNDIVIGNDGSVWNLVKVQGLWYHVDGKEETINDTEVNDEYFLIVKDENDWNKEKHEGKQLAEHKYNGNPPTVPQLRYEISLIQKEVAETLEDIEKISEVISMDQVIETKENIKKIEEKIENYEEIVSILEPEINNENDDSLYTEFNGLEQGIEDLWKEIGNKKAQIVDKAIKRAKSSLEMEDISIAKEAASMIPDKVKEIIHLEKIILAIEKAEITKLEEDIEEVRKEILDYEDNNLKQDLEERIDILEATIAVEKLERTMEREYISPAYKLVNSLNDSEVKSSLKKRIYATIAEIEASEDEQRLINDAKAAVEEVEKSLRDPEKPIDEIEPKVQYAESAIEEVETESIKEQLQSRLEDAKVVVAAIKSVNETENTIKDITETDKLVDIIEITEELVKIAKAEVKKIKDRVIKTTQENRIKTIEVVIKAIKAVDKAETATPLKMTNVNSARKAIDKINDDYESIIRILNDRLDKVESTIRLESEISTAVKAVEKAEKSMKTIDIAAANDAIKLLQISPNRDKLEDIINKLIDRIDATIQMNEVENSLIKYLEESSEDNKKSFEDAFDSANHAINKLNEGTIKSQRIARMIVIEKAKTAIESVQVVKNNVEAEKVKEAEDAIAEVSDSKIKKELENKLKDILSQKELEENIRAAKEALEYAEESLNKDTKLNENIKLVEDAEEAVKKLPSGNTKKDLQAIIKELNNAIKAKEAVENAEVKAENGILVLKDITSAEKAVSKVKFEYKLVEYQLNLNGFKEDLDNRIKDLRNKLDEKEAAELLVKAEEAVNKAIETESTKDITAAKKAINLIKDINQEERDELLDKIEKLEVQIAEKSVENAEESAVQNSKSISKDITAAKKAIDGISNRIDYRDKITGLNTRISALEAYVEAIKVLEKAEKTRNEENKNAAERALADFKLIAEKIKETDEIIYNAVYENIVQDITDRIDNIKTYLLEEEQKVKDALEAVEEAENKVTIDENPSNELIIKAQSTVNLVTDKKLRSDLQKRIDAIYVVMDAKMAVIKAEAYTIEKSVKDAENILNKVDARYSDIIQDLSERIAKLRNQLDVSKMIEEATKLVQKAIDSRKETDIANARFAVDSLKTLGLENYEGLKEVYESLDELLKNLKTSIENEASSELEASKEAQDALREAFDKIKEVNKDIVEIIEGEEEEAEKIQAAYRKIQEAKNHIIVANAAMRRLTNQGDLSTQIDSANEVIDLAEDKVDVKEAIRLVTIASSSVNNARDNYDKSLARLDIAAARRAIDKIGHKNHSDIKKTILNTIDAIERKLISDNDQELIDAAIEEVNKAADVLANAVRENQVMERQEEIDKAIFSARIAIGWISDANKVAKNILTGFLDEIEQAFEAEKEGILNEERIRNAEKAVEEAEAKKGSDELEKYIRIARLRVRIIRNDGPEAEAKIEELNARLDALEGKIGGGSGNTGNNGNNSGSNSGNNKKPSNGARNNNKFRGNTEPLWGKTKELRKTVPTIKLP